MPYMPKETYIRNLQMRPMYHKRDQHIEYTCVCALLQISWRGKVQSLLVFEFQRSTAKKYHALSVALL